MRRYFSCSGLIQAEFVELFFKKFQKGDKFLSKLKDSVVLLISVSKTAGKNCHSPESHYVSKKHKYFNKTLFILNIINIAEC